MLPPATELISTRSRHQADIGAAIVLDLDRVRALHAAAGLDAERDRVAADDVGEDIVLDEAVEAAAGLAGRRGIDRECAGRCLNAGEIGEIVVDHLEIERAAAGQRQEYRVVAVAGGIVGVVEIVVVDPALIVPDPSLLIWTASSSISVNSEFSDRDRAAGRAFRVEQEAVRARRGRGEQRVLDGERREIGVGVGDGDAAARVACQSVTRLLCVNSLTPPRLMACQPSPPPALISTA